MSGEPQRRGDEIHIAGSLVHARLAEVAQVCAAIATLPNADVVQASVDGRLVVVLEAGSARDIVAVLDEIRNLPGVLNVALVYQHAEPTAAMLEEMTP
ncbi:chaperone NapD [Caldimonas brevitalea]|uniref:Chaperone NapD n=1 Tax=Caldimonas brevitalea TaxID=413882 RepID=A0A0G3BLT1_9BURK|nr:chaperone NapD [Caldimonas brevitalea]AKJ28311.1 periplasmic nitrate reductase NapD [Caldimonas brevitalea]